MCAMSRATAPDERDLRIVGERRSLALHHAVGEKLRHDPPLLDRARNRITRWLAEGDIHPRYGQEWLRLLNGPLEELIRVLDDPSDHARALRSCSPFAGVLDPKTRWRIWREVGRE